MADTTTKTILSICATTSDRVKDLVIKNGQLVFVRDAGRIALDYRGKRTFYNQIVEIEAEIERKELLDAVNGNYYFVIETAVLWRYYNGWVQITTPPEDIVFIGVELPELGKPKTLYVDKDDREISIWDEDIDNYLPVANYTGSISEDEVRNLFSL